MSRTILWMALVSGAALILPTATAAAQNALGGGNALDRNLGVGTGGVNTFAPQTNFRERNAIVTGDVIGGRGFRGFVGYTSEFDFREPLGSNDLFRFRADSAIASPQLFQNTTTYEQLRFGQEMGLVEYHRAGSADPASVRAANPISVDSPEYDTRLRVDRLSATSLSSINQLLQNEPRVIGTINDKQGQLLLYNSSPVRGITMEQASGSVGLIGLTTFDAARIREDFEAAGNRRLNIGEGFHTDFEEALKREQIPGQSAPDQALGRDETDNRLSTSTATGEVDVNRESMTADYRRVLTRIADRYANATNVDVQLSPDLAKQLDENYDHLRAQLTHQQATLGPSQVPGTEQSPTPGSAPGVKLKTAAERAEAQREADEKAAAEAAPTPPGELSPPPAAIDFNAILRHGQRIEHLSGQTRDRFNELMAAGEEKLREGDYFSAERRFERALRFVPGHPLATVGTGHAQLGAGLYLSASLTLRNLLARQPEMIDVLYSPELLPDSERLNAAVETITKRMAEGDAPDRAGFAFLLAYIGHQRGDRAMVQTGLDAMAQSDPQNPLVPVLKDVWLAPPGQSPQTAPTTAPTEPGK